VAVEVALVEEPGRLRGLGDGNAALEHLPRDSKAVGELEAVRRHVVGSTEQPRQAVAADTSGALELTERDVVGQLVVQELAGASKRGITSGAAAPVVEMLWTVADVAQPVGEQGLALKRPRRGLERPVQLYEIAVPAARRAGAALGS